MSSHRLTPLSRMEILRRSFFHGGLQALALGFGIATAIFLYGEYKSSAIVAVVVLTLGVAACSFIYTIHKYVTYKFVRVLPVCNSCGSLWAKDEAVILTLSKAPCENCTIGWQIKNEF